MLSGDAAPQQFERVLSYAYPAGAQGFVAGRTIWLSAIENFFSDSDRVLQALHDDSRERLVRLKDLTARLAKPWRPEYERSTPRAEGDFAKGYGFSDQP